MAPNTRESRTSNAPNRPSESSLAASGKRKRSTPKTKARISATSTSKPNLNASSPTEREPSSTTLTTTTTSAPPPAPRTRPQSLHTLISATTRLTSTHIFFHGGPLSNWYTQGAPFTGTRALEILLPLLDAAGVGYPDITALESQMLVNHEFNCGEQWMMGCKAWLMETETGMGIREGREIRVGGCDGGNAGTGMGGDVAADADAALGEGVAASTLSQILATPHPRDQKALGRCVQNFDEELWQRACMPIVIAGSCARAEVEVSGKGEWGFNLLREVYALNANASTGGNGRKEKTIRKFCEGSPRDVIWGVGISWKNRKIDDERNWRGGNLLGRCHDRACEMVLEKEEREGEGGEGGGEEE